MKARITAIKDPGQLSKERLVIRAGGSIDIGDYLVLKTSYRDGQATSAVHNTFWFPDKRVDKGDLIILYSKKGVENEKAWKDGGRSHFFYWGQNEPLWSDENRAAVLLYGSSWSTHHQGADPTGLDEEPG